MEDNNNENNMDAKVTEYPEAVKVMILDELLSYERFKLWVTANYSVHIFKNDEEKRIEVKVLEEDIALAQNTLSRLVKEKLKENNNKIMVVPNMNEKLIKE